MPGFSDQEKRFCDLFHQMNKLPKEEIYLFVSEFVELVELVEFDVE